MNADELLEVMRFDVEGILMDVAKRHWNGVRPCLSQSHRAIKTLEDFLAVHRTVTLLEHREREVVE